MVKVWNVSKTQVLLRKGLWLLMSLLQSEKMVLFLISRYIPDPFFSNIHVAMHQLEWRPQLAENYFVASHFLITSSSS